MKRIYTFFFRSLLLPILFPPVTSFAQNLTGIWRGHFTSQSSGDQYKFELQIDQKKNLISGVSYSYLDTRFYGKATLTGQYNKVSQTAIIQEIKTIELKISPGSGACIMKCSFDYHVSGKEEFLEGSFTAVFEKADTANGHFKGEDCGGGNVFLRKVSTSDFYIEPFLRNTVKNNTEIAPPLQNSGKNNPVNGPASQGNVKINPAKTRPPQSNKGNPAIFKKQPETEKPVQKSGVVKISPQQNKPANDSVIKTDQPIALTENPKMNFTTPDVLTSRENELVKIITVNDPDVTVKIYDNGEIDNDTVSVFLDKKLVLAEKKLTASPLILKIKMDENHPEHELVMVAENLGRIPPNTSLMIVEAGDKRYDVRITSTEEKNAVIRFKYKKPR